MFNESVYRKNARIEWQSCIIVNGGRPHSMYRCSARLRSMTEETWRSANSPSQNGTRYNPPSSLQPLQMDGSLRAPAISTLSSASHIDRLEWWRSVVQRRSVRVERARVCSVIPHSLCCWQAPALRNTSITGHYYTITRYYTPSLHNTFSAFLWISLFCAF